MPIYCDYTYGISQCDYNDYYNDKSSATDPEFAWNGSWVDYNTWRTHAFDGHSTTANPLYVNSAAYNFNIQPGSATILAGTGESAYFTTDIVGTTRPQAGPWSIGAYQYNVPPGPPTGLHSLGP